MRGFTLVETMVYLGLYAIIMTGALVSVYSVVESSVRNQNKAMVQEEGSYLVGKIDWALTSVIINSDGTSAITAPSGSGSGNTLTLSKSGFGTSNPVVITVSGGNMAISRGAGVAQRINNTNTTVVCPGSGCFTHALASGDGIKPESISASFTIYATTTSGLPYSQNFFTIKYLRK